jgi:antitoxin component of RelBE/YafQ-DinJ toxin-antitoxin module
VSATIGVMPNKPKTTLRNVRVDDELWQAAQAAAEARGESVSEAIRKFLKRYAKTGSK